MPIMERGLPLPVHSVSAFSSKWYPDRPRNRPPQDESHQSHLAVAARMPTGPRTRTIPRGACVVPVPDSTLASALAIAESRLRVRGSSVGGTEGGVRGAPSRRVVAPIASSGRGAHADWSTHPHHPTWCLRGACAG